MSKILAIILLACALPVVGAEPPAALEDPDEILVQEALRASILGDAASVRAIAVHRQGEEKRALEKGRKVERLAEDVAALAAATRRPETDLEELRTDLTDQRRDLLTKSLDRLVRRESPRQSYREAGTDRAYEQWRRAYNGFASPIFGLAQAQFFPLISLPFEFADYLFVGHKFPTPERRREVFLARPVAKQPEDPALAAKARSVIERWAKRSRDLMALQARETGDRAAKRGATETAIFWYRHEMEMRGWQEPQRSGHEKVLRTRAREFANSARSLQVIDGDALFASADEFAAYSNLLRSYIAGAGTFAGVAREFEAAYPVSTGVEAVDAARLGESVRNGDKTLAIVQANDMLSSSRAWRARLHDFLALPEYSPAEHLAEAKAKSDHRLTRYIFAGDDPTVLTRSLTQEEARLARQSWVSRARAFFLLDAISRTMVLPFLDPFPRPELVDAAAQLPDEFYATPEGRDWLRTVAYAQRVEKRFRDSAATYRRLGDEDYARGAERRAARALERAADAVSSPVQRVRICERLLNAYPDYNRRERVEKKLKEAQIASDSMARITRDELKAYPELPRQLAVLPSLLDGRKSNGEIAKEGIWLMRADSYVYIDTSSHQYIETPISHDTLMTAFRDVEPRQRAQALVKETGKPLARRRIPLAVEAGMVPGFDAMPGLVPLQPDEKDRVLYE